MFVHKLLSDTFNSAPPGVSACMFTKLVNVEKLMRKLNRAHIKIYGVDKSIPTVFSDMLPAFSYRTCEINEFECPLTLEESDYEDDDLMDQ